MPSLFIVLKATLNNNMYTHAVVQLTMKLVRYSGESYEVMTAWGSGDNRGSKWVMGSDVTATVSVVL